MDPQVLPIHWMLSSHCLAGLGSLHSDALSLYYHRGIHAESARASPAFIPPPGENKVQDCIAVRARVCWCRSVHLPHSQIYAGISEEGSDNESEEDLECLEDLASPDEEIITMSSCPSIDIAVPTELEVNHSSTIKTHLSEVGVRGLPKDLESKPELIPDYMKCCTGSQDELLLQCCIALQVSG